MEQEVIVMIKSVIKTISFNNKERGNKKSLVTPQHQGLCVRQFMILLKHDMIT